MQKAAVLAAFLAAIFLGACDGSGSAVKAEQEFEIVSHEPLSTNSDKCIAAKAAASEWLKLGNKEKYSFWVLISRGYCGFAN